MTDNLDTLETIADQCDKHYNEGAHQRDKRGRKRPNYPKSLFALDSMAARLHKLLMHAPPKSYPYLSKREE